MTGSRRGWGPAVALAAAGAAGWSADLLLPWLAVRDAAGGFRTVGHAELVQRGPLPYEAVLLLLPVVAWVLLLAAGVARAGALRPRAAPLRPLAIALAGTAGFLLLLTGTRWIGFYAARLLEAGPVPVHLHAVPWLHAGLGALLLAIALAALPGGVVPWRAAGARRVLLALAWVFAVTLLALPLLPFASATVTGGTFHYDELSVAIAGAADPRWAPIATALAGARVAAWAGLALCVASLAATAFLRASPQGLRWAALAPWSLVAPVAAGAFFAARLQLAGARLDGVTPGPNWVAPAGFAVAAALLGWHLALSLMTRFGRSRPGPAAPPRNPS